MNGILTLLVSSFTYAASVAPPVVLATHELPNKFEDWILSRPLADWQDEAESKGYVVETDGPVVYVRSRDLYNIGGIEETIDAFRAIELLVRSGTLSKSFGDLDPSARRGLRRILANSVVGEQAGALILNDATQFKIEGMPSLSLTNGRKDVTVTTPPLRGVLDPDGFHSPKPAQEELDTFRKETKPTFALKPYPDRLIFSFSKTSLPSLSNVSMAEHFSKKLFKLLEEQLENYTSGQDRMHAAFMGEDRYPRPGESTKGLNETTQRFIEQTLTNNASQYGFSNDVQLRAFIDDARVKSVIVKTVVFVGIIEPNGNKTSVGSTLSAKRNPRTP